MTGDLIATAFAERVTKGYYTWPDPKIETLLLITIKGQFDVSAYKSWASVGIDMQRIHEVASSKSVKHFILAHNHPNGFMQASIADLEMDRWFWQVGYRFFSGSYIVLVWEPRIVNLIRFGASKKDFPTWKKT